MDENETLIPAWVDGELRPVPKLDAHRRALRHLAVSIFATRGGETLIQRRAFGKYHSGGLWSNACCTHPAWMEEDAACARRRMREELGIEADGLRRVGTVDYRADVGGGLTEHERVAMFAVELSEQIRPEPDPDEVHSVRWIGWDRLEREIAEAPERFTPWLAIYLARHRDMVMGAA